MSEIRAILIVVVTTLLSVGGILALLGGFGAPLTTFIHEEDELTADAHILALYNDAQTDQRIAIDHFYDTSCDCQAQSAKHLDQLLLTGPEYRQRILVPDHTDDVSISWIRARHPGVPILRTRKNPVSAPAIAIYDTEGELRYFGPYGKGASCIQPNDQYFPDMLRSIAANQFTGRFINTRVEGCFCRWSSEQPARAPRMAE